MPPEPLDVEVHRRVLGELTPDLDPDQQARAVAEHVRRLAPLLGPSAIDGMVHRVIDRLAGFGPLEPLLADPDVTEVMVNGPGPVWIERDGRVRLTDVELDRTTIESVVERIVAPLGLRLDRTSPVADARLPDGSRVNAVLPPLAVDGPYLTIRRFGAGPVELTDMATPGVVSLLEWAVAGRCNILISGGTGAGKTTLLNSLASVVPDDQRIVTVEDAAELRLPGPHVVRLEARPATVDGLAAVSVRDLVRNALRMRPDRIVVGEVRGPEAFDMVQAMNTGHEGSLSTCHANSPRDALRRIEAMVVMFEPTLPVSVVREQLDAALDLVVQVARLASGDRRVVEVAELSGDRRRLRPLAGREGLHAVPARPCRRSGHEPPSTAWIEP